jgi:hypothetical protein
MVPFDSSGVMVAGIVGQTGLRVGKGRRGPGISGLPTQVTSWKQQAVEGMSTLFADRRSQSDAAGEEAVKAELYQQIGEVKVDLDFLNTIQSRTSRCFRNLLLATSPQFVLTKGLGSHFQTKQK